MDRLGGDQDVLVFRLGAVVSVMQSALFVGIGVSGLVLGVNRLVDGGVAGLAAASSGVFRALCCCAPLRARVET